MIRIRGSQAWIWVAYEPVLKVFLHFRVSYNQSGLDACLFLKEVRSRYGRKTVWTDGEVWHPERTDSSGWSIMSTPSSEITSSRGSTTP